MSNSLFRNVIVVASPFRAENSTEAEENLEYAKAAMLWEITHCGFDEIPIAPHLLYPRVLMDNVENERGKGIHLGLRLIEHTAKVVRVYHHLGISEGMREEVECASRYKVRVEFADEDPRL